MITLEAIYVIVLDKTNKMRIQAIPHLCLLHLHILGKEGTKGYDVIGWNDIWD
jgi:hypothetical protein